MGSNLLIVNDKRFTDACWLSACILHSQQSPSFSGTLLLWVFHVLKVLHNMILLSPCSSTPVRALSTAIPILRIRDGDRGKGLAEDVWITQGYEISSWQR